MYPKNLLFILFCSSLTFLFWLLIIAWDWPSFLNFWSLSVSFKNLLISLLTVPLAVTGLFAIYSFGLSSIFLGVVTSGSWNSWTLSNVASKLGTLTSVGWNCSALVGTGIDGLATSAKAGLSSSITFCTTFSDWLEIDGKPCVVLIVSSNTPILLKLSKNSGFVKLKLLSWEV